MLCFFLYYNLHNNPYAIKIYYFLNAYKILKYMLFITEKRQTFLRIAFLLFYIFQLHLLQFAFDHINSDTTSYHDYWDRHSLNSRDVFASKAKKPGGFHYGRWLRQFELYVDYISTYIIPVYDWCFLSMLLEGIEKEHSEYSHLQCWQHIP